jgi:dolichyl-phosphate-mannose-protein mannosyltransferase
MQTLQRIRKFLFDRPWIFVIILTALSLAIRLFQIGKINSLIFDEVYFVAFAKNYLTGTSFFDIHPPLGKLIIALGIKIFHDTPFGWRIMSALFGTALIPLIYLTGKELANKTVGFFAALIVALDGMILVYSRLGLMDIFLATFLVASFFFFLKFSKNQKVLNLFLSGVFLGLAASVKYNGFSLLLLLLVIGIVNKVPLKRYLYDYFLMLLVVPLAIYLGFFLFNWHGPDFFHQVYQWHWQSLNYNFHLDATHPYGSKWWSWFLLYRPIWLYFQSENNLYIGVDGLGNPLGWWSSLVIVPLMIYAAVKKEKTNIILLAAFLIFLIPWAFVKRVIFIYHAIPSFLFLSFATAWWLERISKNSYGRLVTVLFFVILLILFIYFLPIWIGWPLTTQSFYHRIWFDRWI